MLNRDVYFENDTSNLHSLLRDSYGVCDPSKRIIQEQKPLWLRRLVQEETAALPTATSAARFPSFTHVKMCIYITCYIHIAYEL